MDQRSTEYVLHDWQSRIRLLEGAYSERTIRGYSSDFRAFEAWCCDNGLSALPASPEIVAAFVRAFTDEHKPATIRRRISAIARIHRLCAAPDPTGSEAVRLSLRRLHRLHGQHQRQPLGLRATLKSKLLAVCENDLRGLRNQAMIMVGYDTLCRRTEMVSLRAEDVAAGDDGAGMVYVRRSKNDPLGAGRNAFLAPETMRVIKHWTKAADFCDGPLFRLVRRSYIGEQALAPYSITRILKELSEKAGLDPRTVANLSSHSFRIGAALDMVEHGIDLLPIMQAGGWTAPEMVLRYTRQVDVAKSGAAQLYRLRAKGEMAPFWAGAAAG